TVSSNTLILLTLTRFIAFFTLIVNTYFKIFFSFTDTATTEIYTLSLHDALPICSLASARIRRFPRRGKMLIFRMSLSHNRTSAADRKSTRLNSSHVAISYAVFCLKKKKKNTQTHDHHISERFK